MGKDKKFKEKIAVFDLDDTLYLGNSHIEILCMYYKTNMFKWRVFKLFGKLFPKIEKKLIGYLYKQIDPIIKENFMLSFNDNVLKLLQKKINEKYFIIIVSNAPKELLINAAKFLHVEYLSAPPNLKGRTLKHEYAYKYLFVCTDNKSDMDLLLLANDSVITCKYKHRAFFEKRLQNKNYHFLEG